MRIRRTAALISSIVACSLSVPSVAAAAAAADADAVSLVHGSSRHKVSFDLQAHRGGPGERTESSVQGAGTR